MLALLVFVAATTPAEHVAKGEELLRALDYDAAVDELMLAAAAPDATDDEKIRANLGAGVAHRILKKDDAARENFRYVLLHAPSTTLPAETTPKVRWFFEAVRHEIEEERATTEPTSATPTNTTTTNATNPTSASTQPPPRSATTNTTTTTTTTTTSIPWITLAATGAGTLAFVGGGVIAAEAEASLAAPSRDGSRIPGTETFGRIALAGSAVGAVVAVVGAVVLASGSAP